MKKIILINFIILLSLFKIYSQEKNYFSIQGDADYYYYFIMLWDKIQWPVVSGQWPVLDSLTLW